MSHLHDTMTEHDMTEEKKKVTVDGTGPATRPTY